MTVAEQTTTTTAAWDRVGPLAHELIDAWGSWAPMMTSDGSRVAFVSDRTGVPQLCVQDVPAAGEPLPEPTILRLGDDPVLSLGWSPDDAWLSCSIATGGGCAPRSGSCDRTAPTPVGSPVGTFTTSWVRGRGKATGWSSRSATTSPIGTTSACSSTP